MAAATTWVARRCLAQLTRRVPQVSRQAIVSSSSFRSLSASSYDNFTPSPPAELTTEIAEGIADTTQFYVRHGVSRQRLVALSKEEDMPAVIKWQKMMEVFLTTQVHVISGLGYSPDEHGLTRYAKDFAGLVESCDDTMRDLFSEARRDTWRDLVSTCFGLSKDDLPTLSIVDSRNLMHKVSSKMIEPDILLEIQTATAKIDEDDPQVEMAKKHQILQEIIVNRVYLGGSPKSIVEEAGFGSGAQAYAKLQCAMSDHEGDPLIAQYATAAMMRIWEAAGLDLSSVKDPSSVPGV